MLIGWILENIPYVKDDKFKNLKISSIEYTEDFKDYERFYNSWYAPPFSLYNLTYEGLHFSKMNVFPIMTTHLSLLKNFYFEFRARIIKNALGWVFQGTRLKNNAMPVFFVMFNITQKSIIRPHILRLDKDDAKNYKRFERVDASTELLNKKWFIIRTEVADDYIKIFLDNKIIFNENFIEAPYRDYCNFPNKLGEVGFRCHQTEEAIVNYVKVGELI